MKKDDFGDRMKSYEATTDVRLPADKPIVARIDGRNFSKFTKGMQKPFDSHMAEAMQATTQRLVQDSHAKIGYTQSDEITLIFEATEMGDHFFGGRVLKLASVLAGMATINFALSLPDRARVADKRPHFDCRVFSVPNREEASNALLWRAQDAIKNSIQSVGQHYFTHKQLQGVSGDQIVRKLWDEHKVRMSDHPAAMVYGTYFQRRVEQRHLTEEEWLRIPESKRPDPDAVVTRSSVQALEITDFNRIGNRKDVIFLGNEAEYYDA